RRRHTRFDCDWSSDVCSSDLYGSITVNGGGDLNTLFPKNAAAGLILSSNTYNLKGLLGAGVYQDCFLMHGLAIAGRAANRPSSKIGRASCRERGEVAVGRGEW